MYTYTCTACNYDADNRKSFDKHRISKKHKKKEALESTNKDIYKVTANFKTERKFNKDEAVECSLSTILYLKEMREKYTKMLEDVSKQLIDEIKKNGPNVDKLTKDKQQYTACIEYINSGDAEKILFSTIASLSDLD
jgi:hypothetical protein